MMVAGALRAVKIEFPYIQVVRARGKRYAYYRRSGASVRIAGEIGSFEWRQAYDHVHRDFERAAIRQPPDRPPIMPGSLEALWMAYRASGDYRRLAPGTQSGYEALMRPIVADWGHGIVAKLKRDWVQGRIDEVDTTPRKANALLAVLRLLLTWGVARDWLAANPAKLVRPVRYRRAPHRVWTQAEIDAMTAVGCPVAVAVLIALYTGQRQGDVLAMPWPAYDAAGGVMRLTQGKTGAVLVIPVHPRLVTALAAAPRSDDTICTRPDGARWKADHFKHVFAAYRRRIGLPDDLHFHGLRHSAASRLAEAGCSHAEIAAITGHKSVAMVAHYAAGARQEYLAKAAMARLDLRPAKRRSVKRPSGEL